MTNTILGISYGHHESSIFLYDPVTNEKLFIAEEWVSRVKGDSRFPNFSLTYLRNNYKHKYEKINKVVHFQKPLRNFLGSGMKKNILNADHYKLKLRKFHSTDIFVEKKIKKVIKNKCEILYCDHHYSHILTNVAFLPEIMPSKTRIHIILDGYGDGKSGGVYQESFLNSNYNIVKHKEFSYQHSLGLLYSSITEWAGFTPNEDEYKVMALASFGNESLLEKANQICYYDKNKKNIVIEHGYFNFDDYSHITFTSKFTDLFGFADVTDLDTKKLWGSNLCNVINAFQRTIEKCIFDLIDIYLESLNLDKDSVIACGGGVFHNSVLVGKLLKKYGNKIFVPPCPGDMGSSIGAVNFGLLTSGLKPISNIWPFIGPKAEDLNSYNNLFKCVASGHIESVVAIKELLNINETVAIYNGNFEIGPRALGSRSLICNGNSLKAVTSLNERLKKRESFRPIAPICDDVLIRKILNIESDSLSTIFKWMGAVSEIINIDSEKSPSCMHHDKTIRVQSLMENINNEYPPSYKLLKLLLNSFDFIGNTSFNIAGDPMVFQAEDVYVNLHRLGVDFVYNNENLYKIIDVYN